MSLTLINADEALSRLEDFDTVIDARSEGEYAEDHLPASVNWPTLNNAQRIHVGTVYKQISAFEAKKQGAAIAARNISIHLEQHVLQKPKDWKPLTYCWRGGKRSGSLSLVLDQIGFRVTLLEGGYKAFRAAMLKDIERLAGQFSWRVICGTTGSGKTRLLQALAVQGAQVLDLEALANHRSSVLGAVPGLPQPTQKHFDTRVWDALRHLDPDRPVFIESESKKVGNVSVPLPLIEAMRASTCLNLLLEDKERVALLLEDYDFFVRNADSFCERLDALVQIRGKAVVEQWKRLVRQGEFEPVVRELLTQHYDPVYIASMERNFKCFKDSKKIAPKDRSVRAMNELASELATQES
jgi:tRNA 2-selenouridine synthase